MQAVADASTRQHNISVMRKAGVMQLLRPLLLDNVSTANLCLMHVTRQVPSIQQSAALALGRLASYSEELAKAIVGNEILTQLVYSLSEQNVSVDCLPAKLDELNTAFRKKGRIFRSSSSCEAFSGACTCRCRLWSFGGINTVPGRV